MPVADYRLAAAIALGLTLAACGEDAAQSPGDEDGRSASGDVLEGTISDAMLPLDRLRSQPPLAAPEPKEDGGSAAPPNIDETALPADAAPPSDTPVDETADEAAAEEG